MRPGAPIRGEPDGGPCAPSIHIGGSQLSAAGNGTAKVGFRDRGVISDTGTLPVEIAAPDKVSGIGVLTDRANGQIGIGPHKKVHNARVGTTLRGDHARPPWSFVSLPSHVTVFIPLRPRYAIKTRLYEQPVTSAVQYRPQCIFAASPRSACNLCLGKQAFFWWTVVSTQTRSSTTAMPWPTPIHMDTRP